MKVKCTAGHVIPKAGIHRQDGLVFYVCRKCESGGVISPRASMIFISLEKQDQDIVALSKHLWNTEGREVKPATKKQRRRWARQ